MLGRKSKDLAWAAAVLLLVATLLTSCRPGTPVKVGPPPSTATTGISRFKVLKPWSGAWTTRGRSLPTRRIGGHIYKVIDGVTFNAGTTGKYFEVDDPYVYIQNSRFTTSGQVSNTSAMLQVATSNRSLMIANSEFDGGRYFQRGVQSDHGDLMVTRSRFHNTGESAIEKNDRQASSSLMVTDCYITNDKGWPRGQHVDGIQVGGAKNVVISHNTILNQPFGGTTGDTNYVSNSALGLWAELGNVSGSVVVNRNLLAGGGRTIYIEQKAPYRWQGPVSITNNTFDTRFGPKGAVWGPLYPAGLPSRLTWTGNKFSDGRPVSLTSAEKNYP